MKEKKISLKKVELWLVMDDHPTFDLEQLFLFDVVQSSPIIILDMKVKTIDDLEVIY